MKRKTRKLWGRICAAYKRAPKNSDRRLSGTEILSLSDFDEELLGYLRSDLATLGNLLADNDDPDYGKFGAALEIVDRYLNEIKESKREKEDLYLTIRGSASVP